METIPTVTGYCSECDEIMEADAIDILFDMKPSCAKCGNWLAEPLKMSDIGQVS